MKLPDLPFPGSRLSIRWAEQLYAYLRSVTPYSSQSVRIDRAADGFKAVWVPVPVGEDSTSAPRTFYCSPGSEAGKVVVSPGVIRNVIPRIGGVLMVSTPTPEISISSGQGIYIHATFDAAGKVTAVTIEALSNPMDSDTDAYVMIAYAFTPAATTENPEPVMQIIPVAWNYSQVQRCGSLYIWGGFSG